MKEWKTYKVGDICSSISETYKSKSKSVVLINTSDVLEGRCLNHEFVPNKDLKGQFKKVFKFGDILYSEIRPANKRFAYIDFDATDYIASTKLMVLRNNDKVTNRFLYHYLKSESTIAELQALAESRSGTFPQITFSELSQLEISIPDIETQLAISSFIDTLESKIELNRQINDNLEQQLKLLYRSWFIENKHPDSKEVCLSEIIYFQEGPGIRNWQYVEKDGIKFINIRCIEGGDINLTTANMISEEEANGKYAHFMLKPFDIIMSCSGTLGRYAIVRKEHLPLCLNTSVIRFSPNRSESDYSYIYGYLASEEFLNKQVEMACGSVQANFGPTHLKQIKIIAPPIDYCKSYHTAAMPIISKILENRREIQYLGKLRDTLLPKLMSGELKINEIDC